MSEVANQQKQWVFLFTELDKAEAACSAKSWDDVRSFLGGKGANLFEMTRLEPAGASRLHGDDRSLQCLPGRQPRIPHQACGTKKWPPCTPVEQQVGKKFGDPKNPLFVSCRSGAKFSMPGMMDTVLNIGLNDETAKGMIKLTGDPRFVYDSYRRLIQMFGSVVMGVADEPFEEAITEQKKKSGMRHDVDLTADDWKAMVERFKTRW
jgi:pyruvate,orthophosphate dikinase